jgi:hypothetical protein
MGDSIEKESRFKGSIPLERSFQAINAHSPKLPLMAFFLPENPPF